MAYIGKQPAVAALTASDITDGIISNAKLAQDIISADTALGATPADTDEFLVSDAGTLKRMDYSYIKAGGAWNLLSTATTSDQSSIEITSGLDSTYRFYSVMMSEIVPANDNEDFVLQVSQDGGSTWLSAGGYRGAYTSYGYGDTNSLANHASNDAASYKLFSDSQNQADSASIIFYIDNPSGTSYEKLIWGSGVLWNNSGVLSSSNFAATYDGTNPTSAINAIKLAYSSGNISAVTKLYGIS